MKALGFIVYQAIGLRIYYLDAAGHQGSGFGEAIDGASQHGRVIQTLATPTNITCQAYHSHLPGIPGYQRLELGLNSRNITINDLIEAAGEKSPQS